MSNNYAPCFNRIDFVVTPSYIELQRMTLLMKIMPTIVEKSFFHTNKCKCMSLNVRIEILISKRNENVFRCSILNPDLFILESYDTCNSSSV